MATTESAAAAGVSSGGEIPQTTTSIKLLVGNKAVGQVIGKGGAMINSIKESSSANIKISSSGEFYPGTQDRVILVSGSVNSALTASQLIIAEVSKHQAANAAEDAAATAAPGEMTLTLALPGGACGLVIGKGGERISILREQCSCKMHMQSKEKAAPGVEERLLTVTGALANVQMATEKVILLMAEDGSVHYDNNTTAYTTFPSLAFNAKTSLQGMSAAGQSGLLHSMDQMQVQIRLGVPELSVGNLVGKGGATIKEIIAICGAQVRLSQKGELDPATGHRIVTITGNTLSSSYAHMLILQRVPEAVQLQ
jgi:RNA-binding protein Nova